MADADAPPSNAERSPGVPGDTPIRLSILGTLEPDLLDRLRRSSTAVVQVVDPQGGIECDGYSSGDTHACLVDHRSNTPAPVPTSLLPLPQLLLVDPAQPPGDDYLLARPHVELVSATDIGTLVFDTRLRLAIERRRQMPADPIRRHAFDILEQVMHQTTDWIVVKDLQRRFRFVSQSFADSFDLPIEQIIGRDDLQIGTPQRLVLGDETTGWKGYWEIDDDVIASGEPKARQSIVQQEDEHGQKLERSDLIPLKDDAGQVYGLMVGVSEVYRPSEGSSDLRKRPRSAKVRRNSMSRVPMLEQLHAEKSSAEAREQISRQAYLEKNRFIAAASHDLRQPLHALGLYLAALGKRATAPADAELVGHMKQSMNSINELLNSLLDLSRLDANVVEVKATSFAISTLLKPLRDELLPVADERNLALRLSPVDAVVHTDRVLLGRVLRNLLDNAIKHTRDGSVSIACEVRGSGLNLEISDTGPGIPADKQKTVFDEFLQLGQPDPESAKGLGLGLAIVQKLCRLLDLKLVLQSAPGQGTHFGLTIPLGLSARKVSALPPIEPPIEQTHLILVVDDDASVRRAMGLTIEGHGCEALLADSVESAIESVNRIVRVPDALLMDYRLGGGMTGDRAIEQLRSHLGVQVPAILITGDTSTESLREMQQSGCRVLNKPVDPDELLRCIGEMIEG